MSLVYGAEICGLGVVLQLHRQLQGTVILRIPSIEPDGLVPTRNSGTLSSVCWHPRWCFLRQTVLSSPMICR